MAVRKRISASIGPVRELALRHVPAMMILQRHVDADWNEMPFVSEQVVAGFYYPEEVDQYEKENENKNEGGPDDIPSEWNPTGSESRRRSPEENEGRKVVREPHYPEPVEGESSGSHLSDL